MSRINDFVKMLGGKKPVEEIKALPMNPTRTVTKELRLVELKMAYSVTRRNQYYANIRYSDNDSYLADNATNEETEITASSWPELIDKVYEYMEVSHD